MKFRTSRRKAFKRKRSVSRRRGTFTKRRYGRRPKPANFRGVHYFKRTVTLEREYNATGVQNIQYSTSAGASVAFEGGKLLVTTPAASTILTSYFSFGYRFNLANLFNKTEFTNLFDSYKIRKVVVKFIPFNTVVGASANTIPGFAPLMHYFIDHDDYVNESLASGGEHALAEMHQRNNYKVTRLANVHTIVIVPRCTAKAFGAAGNSAMSVSRREWLDVLEENIDHFGLKFVLEAAPPTATAAVWACRVETTYYLSFKGVR